MKELMVFIISVVLGVVGVVSLLAVGFDPRVAAFVGGIFAFVLGVNSSRMAR